MKRAKFPETRKTPEPLKTLGFSLELMGGVEQISNSETVEISRKERRPSHGVFKSVSNHRYI